MTTKAMSHPVLSSAFFIASRTLLNATLWFVLWTARDYFSATGGFRPRVSSGDILFYLFVGWLFALMNWKSGGDKKNRSQ